MSGEWQNFQQLKPRRLQVGLPIDHCQYHIYSLGGWVTGASRDNPNVQPWDREGWYIPYPEGWDFMKYKKCAPDRMVFSSMEGYYFWCFNVERDEWYMGTKGDWVIPYAIYMTEEMIESSMVVHDW